MPPLFPQQVAQEHRAVSSQCNASCWTLSGSLSLTFNFRTEDTCFFASGDLLFGGGGRIYCHTYLCAVLGCLNSDLDSYRNIYRVNTLWLVVSLQLCVQL